MIQKTLSLNDKSVPINEITTPIDLIVKDIISIAIPIHKYSPTREGLIAIPTKANK